MGEATPTKSVFKFCLGFSPFASDMLDETSTLGESQAGRVLLVYSRWQSFSGRPRGRLYSKTGQGLKTFAVGQSDCRFHFRD